MLIPETLTCAELKVWLADAELALHRFYTGTQTVSVTYGPSKSTTFNQVNVAKLEDYVNRLRERVAACCGPANAVKPRGPIHMVFGDGR